MKKLWQLPSKSRRSHAKLLRKMRRREDEGYDSLFLRGADTFRIAERLHKAGLILVRISKWNWYLPTGYPFKELEATTLGATGVRRSCGGPLRTDKLA